MGREAASKEEIIKFRTDEKIRLEEERHKLIMLRLKTEHENQVDYAEREKERLQLELRKAEEEQKHGLELYEKNMEQLRLELQRIEAEKELVHLQSQMLTLSMGASKLMKETGLTSEPFDEEKFASIFAEKVIEMENLDRKLKEAGQR